jgi:hypothetical protein
MPQMFQQALWIGGTDWEDEGQEVDLRKSMTGAGLGKKLGPFTFRKSGINFGRNDRTSEESGSTYLMQYWRRNQTG